MKAFYISVGGIKHSMRFCESSVLPIVKIFKKKWFHGWHLELFKSSAIAHLRIWSYHTRYEMQKTPPINTISLIPRTLANVYRSYRKWRRSKNSYLAILFRKNPPCCLVIIELLIQSSVVITRCNLSRYYLRHSDYRSRTSIKLRTHNRHTIPRPHGRAMRCLLWAFWRKLTAL